jgi:hypothetical protein
LAVASWDFDGIARRSGMTSQTITAVPIDIAAVPALVRPSTP